MNQFQNQNLDGIKALDPRLASLNDLELRVVELLSVIYEFTTRTTLNNCLRELGIRDEAGRAFTLKSLGRLVQEFEQQGVVEIQENKLRAHPEIREQATRYAVTQGRFRACAAAVLVQCCARSGWQTGRFFENYDQILRDIRIALYSNDEPGVFRLLEQAHRTFPEQFVAQHPLSLVCFQSFDPQWFEALSDSLAFSALMAALSYSFWSLSDSSDAFELFQQRLKISGLENFSSRFLSFTAMQYLMRGKLSQLQSLFLENQGPELDSFRACIAFLEGENAESLLLYRQALAQLKKSSKKRKIFFQDLSGLFFILALIAENDPACLEEAAGYLDFTTKKDDHIFKDGYSLLYWAIRAQQGQGSYLRMLEKSRVPEAVEDHLDFFIHKLILCWLAPDKAGNGAFLMQMAHWARQAGYLWYATEVDRLLVELNLKERPPESSELEEVRNLATLVRKEAPWERSLKALLSLSSRHAQGGKAKEGQTRLIWLLTLDDNFLSMSPLQQKLGASGKWSKGRSLSLKKLRMEGDLLDFLSDQDRRICSHIQEEYERDYYYAQRRRVFLFDMPRALAELVEHPLLFWQESPDTRVELVRGEPELQILKEGGQIRIRMEPDISELGEMMVVRQSPTNLKLIDAREEHLQIASLLGEGLKVPLAAEKKVLEVLGGISSMVTVHSDIGGALAAREVEADSRPTFHLMPWGEGLKVQVLVRPLAGGPCYSPGAGGETVIAEIEGERLQTRRDLDAEHQTMESLTQSCVTLRLYPELEGERLIETPADCLELLCELQALGDEARVEWPKGQNFKVVQNAGAEKFSMSIRRNKEWFAVTGELELDESKILDLQQLLGLLDQGQGRFIPLGDGEYMALSSHFLKRLRELEGLSEKQGRGVRISSLAGGAIAGLASEAGQCSTDKEWKDQSRRIDEAMSLSPELPGTLQAELRDYQHEGFQWMARLAHWGAGACLADDMGLGKTVQALALILSRASSGPTLVVAPTSVCANWEDEARRFAPSLRVLPFGVGDRQKMLDELQPFDLLVCSYGLLQQQGEALAAVRFATLVLDEAQAIKNMDTKRSRAAMALQGDFKLITTGTPIENHLGELWNLFRFINPGLLGSREAFNRRFALPIEKTGNKEVRTRLKRLLAPFILRRIKSQVLEELPPRTEINLQVELSREEMELYEAFRRKALQSFRGKGLPEGQRQLQILAEIMKLRRLCCNPRLVLPETSIPGSKLAVFARVVDELRENRHKALVFSQFVGHLEILREHLDARGIPYQYLDGSTPALQRKKRIAAFQGGQGDLFLISLKAGGVGLNLTAADYVIHMDPWWNPAVEDQASDRAHRIGQTRPVTVYRLITKGTIEEQIVELHKQKRELADNLLEGAETGKRISGDDLLALLKEPEDPWG